MGKHESKPKKQENIDFLEEENEELSSDQVATPISSLPEDILVQLDQLEQKNTQLEEQRVRQLAEFDNYKKRTSKEKDNLYHQAQMDTILVLLGVLDNFERALETDCNDLNFKQGVEMILKQLQQSFDTLGVTELMALGESFDPQLHNAVNQVEDENFGENTVCQVLQKGYYFKEQVLRHAMVVVANP